MLCLTKLTVCIVCNAICNSHILYIQTFGESSVIFVKTDVTESEDWDRLWEKSVEFFGSQINVLVNNAGVSPSLGFERCMQETLKTPA